MTIYLPTGKLQITWRAEDDHVIMTAPVTLEWSGTVVPETGDWLRNDKIAAAIS